MPTSTSNFGLLQPLVNSGTDQDLWGGYLNQNIGNDDTLLLSAMTHETVPQTANFSVAGRTAGTPATGSLRNLFLCNCTAGAITGSLPAAASVDNGFVVAFKKEDVSANALTIAPAGSDTIDNAASLIVSSQFDSFVLVSDGASNWNILCYKHGVTPKNFSMNVQQFTSSGTYTPSAGLAYAIIELVGAGGGGGGVASTYDAGAGGGSAAYLKCLLTAAQIGSSQPVTVSPGGAGGASGGGAGVSGGATSVGSLLVCNGGGGGQHSGQNATAAGGGGGAIPASAGQVLLALPGQAGQAGGQNDQAFGGSGGSNPLGSGALGVFWPGVNLGSAAGSTATGYGAGGSGATNGLGTTANPGGAGAPGVVIVTEFMFA